MSLAPAEPLAGLLNLYKPVGITSAKALYRVRKLAGERKSGHAGTLDPAAEGVLLICFGRATRMVERLMELPKTYVASARLDATSDSFDSDAAVREVAVAQVPTRAEVEAALGEIARCPTQTPPAISALKIGGRPAYRLARAGKPAVLAPRPVRIYAIRLLEYAWPTLRFEMRCGRGTYVRAVARDLGIALRTGGCLTGLVRTAVGPFDAAGASTLESLATGGVRPAVLPLEELTELLARSPSGTG